MAANLKTRRSARLGLIGAWALPWSLFAVLLLAHALILLGHSIPLSLWTPVAYLWEDAWVALAFATVTAGFRRHWFSWSLYASIILYVALNVPIARVLSTPLTWTMLRAARGPLAGSVWHCVTLQNCLLIAAVLGCGAALPFCLWRSPAFRNHSARSHFGHHRVLRLATMAAGLAGLLALGRYATRQVETIGLHRNPLMALVTSSFPWVQPLRLEGDWRASPFASSWSEDLSRWRGSCRSRNVILILLESTGAQYLRPFGAANDPMPNVTELASRSILLENAYSVYPESIKGLFSVLCSQYPAIDTQPSQYSRVTVPSLAQALRQHGFRTALFHSGRFIYLGMESIVRGRGFDTLEDAGDIGGNYQSSFGIDEPAAVNRILAWIDSQRGTPFFITYLPIAGHHPYDAPEGGPFAADDELGSYFNALHYGDAALGQLFCGLRQRHLFDQTLFVLAGDHGEAFGQHEGNYGHTLFLYEENVHVPLILAAPGLLSGQVRLERTASLIDIAPTILDLLGLVPPDSCQGRSLLAGREQMSLFFADYSLGFLGLRDGRYKFILELDSGRFKLFDLTIDPAERANITSALPERAAAYGQLLRAWSAAQKERISNRRFQSSNLKSSSPGR